MNKDVVQELDIKELEKIKNKMDNEEKELFQKAVEVRELKLKVIKFGIELKHHEKQQLIECSSIEEVKSYKSLYEKLSKANLL